MGDNGDKVKAQKSAEELAQEAIEAKKARFTQNPDSFVELAELIIAVKRAPQGMGVLVTPLTKVELQIAQSELNFEIHLCFIRLKAAAMQEKQPRIVKPTRGAFGFRRN